MHFPLPETSLFDIAKHVVPGLEIQVTDGMATTKHWLPPWEFVHILARER